MALAVRLGHAPALFAERDGKRVFVADVVPDAPATLDELVRTDFDSVLRQLDEALADATVASDAQAALDPPLRRPSKIVAIGLNYLDHCREFGVDPPREPIVFAKFPSAIVGHGADVVWDEQLTAEVDFEAELAAVIGRDTRSVREADALEHVFGYTIVNDVTARDVQRNEQQWVRAKSFDSFCPLGPVVVTSEDVLDPQALRVQARVNGVEMQSGTTADMIAGVAELISYLSRSFTLERGDVIATGTPVGVGAFREPPVFLRDGDNVEIEIERIGILTNVCRTLGGGL